jgi:hypothetical protein
MLREGARKPAVVVAEQPLDRIGGSPTPPMIVSDSTAAIRPYSMAVAPVSSFKIAGAMISWSSILLSGP